jgi:hypothetical protein
MKHKNDVIKDFFSIHQVMGTLLEAGEAASKFSAFQMGIQVRS